MHSKTIEEFMTLLSIALPFPPEPASLSSFRAMALRSLPHAFQCRKKSMQNVIGSILQTHCSSKQYDKNFRFSKAYTDLPALITSMNGCWQRPNFHIPGIIFSSLATIDDHQIAILSKAWERYVPCDQDILSLLTCAFYQDILFIHVAPNTDVQHPLHILHTMDVVHSFRPTMPRIHIWLEKNASLKVIEMSGAAPFLNAHLSVDIEEGGRLFHTRIDNCSASNTTCSSLRANLKKNASLTSILATATPLAGHTTSINLDEEGASAYCQGVTILPSSYRSYLSCSIDHRAPKTISSQLYKGIVTDSSVGSCESTVRIFPEAQKSTSHQYSHFLTLGSTAQTFNRPQFEIFADDITASHGATSGVIDQDTLFYLTSRGLCTEEARQYLIEGFCEDIIKKLPLTTISTFSQCILDITRECS